MLVDRELDVELFSEYEFPVFMEYAKIYAEPEKVLEGLYIVSDLYLPGHTPLEIAYMIYRQSQTQRRMWLEYLAQDDLSDLLKATRKAPAFKYEQPDLKRKTRMRPR